MEWIYETLKDTYNLTYTCTAALDDGYTIDVPVIRGVTENGHFDLYEDGELYVFSFVVFSEEGKAQYSHTHFYDAMDAITYIQKFMQGKPIFD